jgi:hypothetical protein
VHERCPHNACRFRGLDSKPHRPRPASPFAFRAARGQYCSDRKLYTLCSPRCNGSCCSVAGSAQSSCWKVCIGSSFCKAVQRKLRLQSLVATTQRRCCNPLRLGSVHPSIIGWDPRVALRVFATSWSRVCCLLHPLPHVCNAAVLARFHFPTSACDSCPG